jgi:hypothetical protein
MRKSVAIALAAALCAAATAFAYPQKAAEITVSGYTGSALANFPVLVRISPERISGFSYADCAAGGADIAFKDTQGNVLDREVDTWDTEGESLVWVRFPVLANNTAVTMTYKDPSATAQPACQTNGSVWTGANYIGVWHFSEDGGTAADSTGHGLNGAQTGSTSLAPQSKVGGARAVASGALQVANYEATYGGATVFSASGWFYCPGVTAGYRSIMNKKTTAGAAWNSASGWYLEMNNSLTQIGLIGCNNTKYTCNIPNITQGWNYFHVVSSGSNVKLYLNGSASPGINQNHALKAAGVPLNLMPTVGYADEFRIRGAANSADWTVAEYQTVANAAFLTYGTAQNLPGDFIQVVGLPMAYSANNSPAYGTTVNPAAGTHSFTAPQFVEVSAGVRAYCTGWSLASVADGVETPVRTSASPASGEDDFTCVIDYAGAGGQILAWNWEIRYRVTAATETGGSVSPAEQWVASGATATMTATADATHSFYKWTNDVPASVSATSPTISFPVTAPMSLFATFGNVLYVAANGSDANGGTTWEDAFATPEKALSIAPHGSVILVGPGTYETVGEEIRVTNNVVFRGAEGRATTILKAVNPNGTKKNGSIIKRRVLYVNASGALVEGFTMTGGYWYNYGSQTTDYLSSNIGGGDLVLKNGTVRDCIITGVSNGGTYGGGVNMSGGTITNCIIRGNNSQYNNNTTGLGGGIYMSNGLVVDCVITNNSCGQYGSGVYMDGGTLRNCLVAGNKGLQRLGVTGAIFQNKASVVENCVVKGHTSNHARAGLYLNQANAIARNTLVFGNTGVYSGQGAYVANGQIQNCTLAGNTSQFDTTGAGLYQDAGTIVNTIVSGAGVDKPSYIRVASGATFKTNLTDAAVSTSSATVADNLHGLPRFADAANHDYTLRFDSPAVGAAQPLASVKTDLAGVARTPTPSIGCYEHVPSGTLACSFLLPETRLGAGGSFTATAVVEGASGDTTYAWYLDGVQQECTGAVFEFSAPATTGAHALRLVVTSGGESASYEEAAAFAVLPSVTYSNINGSDTFPYDTREKGAHHLQDAVDACWCTDNAPGTVHVAPGTYPVDGIWTRIQKAIRVVSEDGPATTILKAKNDADVNKLRHVLYIAHEEAIVSGFTIRDADWYSANGGNAPGAIQMSAGTVTNCVITNNRGGGNGDNVSGGGGVELSGGTVVDCIIRGNWSVYNNDGTTGQGGGVRMTGGLVHGCVISNNWAGCNPCGSGVWMNGGTLSNCVVAANYVKGNSKQGVGIAMKGGTVTRCHIWGNGKLGTTDRVPGTGGGVFISGGTLRNSLVEDNKVNDSGAGVYQTGGTMEFCTVAGNTSTGSGGSGLYLNGSKAVARYNVIYGNGAGTSTEPNCNIAYTAAASFATNVVAPATSGADNIADDPLFTDAANGDYTLSTGSSAIDKAPVADAPSADLAGDARPTDGNGDGTALADLGCFEAADASAGALRCSFSPSSVAGHDSVTATFSASVSGTGSDGQLTYTWDFGEGATDIAYADGGATATATFATYGVHPVSLTVSAGNSSASAEVDDCVRVGSSVIHLKADNANPVWPYNTVETAATNIVEAVSSAILAEGVRQEYIVHAGTYPITEQWIILSSPTWIHGVDGADRCVFTAAYPTTNQRRLFYVNHQATLVEGVTLANGYWNGNSFGYSGCTRIDAGAISNCVIRNCYGGNTAGQLEIHGGEVVGCVIRNGGSKADGNVSKGRGGGVGMLGPGKLISCVVTNNYACESGDGYAGGGICITDAGAVVRDCLIAHNNARDDNRNGGGIAMTAGLVENCVIRDNVAYGNYGGVYQMGGTVRNCLISGNWAPRTTNQGVGVTAASAQFINNTVVTNGCAAQPSGKAANLTAGMVKNSIFWGSIGTDVNQGGATVANCQIGGDPAFKNPARGDWRLLPTSSCINAGDWTALGESREAVRAMSDLSGASRLFGGQVDLGCYESRVAGTMILLR